MTGFTVMRKELPKPNQPHSVTINRQSNKGCRETISLLNDNLEGISASQATKILKYFV